MNLAVLYIEFLCMLLFLIYFSYLDLKYREIPDRYIYSFTLVSLLIFFVNLYDSVNTSLRPIILDLIFFIVSIIVGPLFSYILYKLDLFGLADVYVITGLSLAFYNDSIYSILMFKYNTPIHIPPVIPILLYANLIMAFYIPYNMLRNFISYSKILPPKNIGIIKWILIVSTGKPMKIQEYLSSKHIYSLQIYEPHESGIRVKYRTTFNIEEDPELSKNIIKSLIDKGYLNQDDYIWVTHGVPFIVLILLGFVIFTMIGDVPIHIIISIFT